jgi:hypothetical protein
MHHRSPVIAATAALLLAFGVIITGLVGGTAAHAATSLCQSQTAGVSSGTYIVQNNEWNSSASECVTTDGNADFTVQRWRTDQHPGPGLEPDPGQGYD